MPRFRLTLSFVLASILAIGVASLVVDRVVNNLAEGSLLQKAREHTALDAETIQSAIQRHASLHELPVPANGTGGSPSSAIYTVDVAAGLLPGIMPELAAELNLLKLSLFDLNGDTVWSSDATSVGTNQGGSENFLSAASGASSSGLMQRLEVVDTVGTPRTVDAVETYLPLRSAPTGPVIGVLELYRDAEDGAAIQIADARSMVVWMTVATMGGLFLVLVGFIATADITIYRANKRELSLVKDQKRKILRERQEIEHANRELAREITERKQMEQKLRLSEADQRRLAAECGAIAAIGRIISSTVDIEEVYGNFAEQVRALIPFDRIVITLTDTKPGVLVASYVSGLPVPEWNKGCLLNLAGTVEEKAIRTRSAFVCSLDSLEEVNRRFPAELPGFEAGIRSTLVTPLISGDEVIGCLGLCSTSSNVYRDAEMDLAQTVADQIAGAVANSQLYSQLTGARDVMRESEARLLELFEEAPVGYHEVDPDGRITRVNRTELEMLGYTAEEMVGRHIFEFIEGGDALREGFAEMVAGNSSPGPPFERTLRRKDGSMVPVLVESRVFTDQSGKVTGIRITNQDISARKRAEEAAARQARELARSNADLEQFAYVASHDLQEPLRMVKSYTQLLAENYKGRLDSDADEFIAYASDAATRMGALINDLLTYSRVDSLDKEFQTTDCEQVLEHALLNLKAAVEESGAVVTHDPMPTLVGDGKQMVQLFQNLIGNAIKYRGERRPEIHVGSERRQGEWLIWVRDNGIGIDPKYSRRIFGVFQRLHNRARYSGTGIGLALCKSIVERHGGRIWVDSELGKGSTFNLTIVDQRGNSS